MAHVYHDYIRSKVTVYVGVAVGDWEFLVLSLWHFGSLAHCVTRARGTSASVLGTDLQKTVIIAAGLKLRNT